MLIEDKRLGLLYALAGFAVLSVGDAVVKTMAGQWSPIAVAALRFSMGAVGLSSLLFWREGRQALHPQRPFLQVIRGFCLAMATICFFSAIYVMPLAEATALIFMSPVFTAILSGVILKEKVSPVTWLASLVAFAGVILVLRPNLADVGLVALFPLGSAVFFSLMLVANRAVVGQGSALAMQAYIAFWAAPFLIAAAIIGNASGIALYSAGYPSLIVVAKCLIVAITASTAHWLVYIGTAKAGAAAIAPMTYVQLLVAIILGWAWFDNSPDLVTLLGSSIIIGAGLLIWRASKKTQQPGKTN